MKHWLGLDRLTLWLLRKIQFLWVRTKVLPETARPEGFDPDKPVCYVLERSGLADLLVLEQVCLEHGLLVPTEGLHIGEGVDERLAVLRLRRFSGLIVRRPTGKPSPRLGRLVAFAREQPGFDLQIVPVAIYWGRGPEKERSGLKLLLSEDWAIGGRFRRFLTVLLNGRNTLVQFSAPLSMRLLMDEGAEPARIVRKISRVLRVHYRRLRVATIGPDLSHRRTIVDQILQTRSVRAAIAREIEKDRSSEREAEAKARKYALEIASDYSYRVILILDRILTWLWNKLYDGIEVKHLENLESVSQGNEIVYVPCHRSHIDYLLLSYVVYHNGFAIPQVAAGINLNLPVIGRILRRGGAFFLRRSFKGNVLYSAVFSAYLSAMLVRGFPIEYFIEGGRSRTGRLLPPKPGMLSMTVQSYLTKSRLPIVFQPVYFGYERLVEGRTYIGELSGRPKEKESVLGIFRALPALRSRFGKVFVAFGEPIHLEALLIQHRPGWKDAPPSGNRPAWITPVVDELARTIMVRINEAAVLSPVNLLAVILLATPKQAILETDLLAQVELYKRLLRDAPYGPFVSVAEADGKSVIQYGEALGVIKRQEHPLGDVILMEEEEAVLMTYFRNNALHLFALPSLVACCFLNNRTLKLEKLVELIKLVYPYIRGELFLRWSMSELEAAIGSSTDALVAQRLLEYRAQKGELVRPRAESLQAVQLQNLARATIQTLQRYYMAIALLVKNGSGALSRRELETQCHLVAQRMSLLHELNSPEFFDKTLFKGFIDLLCKHQVVEVDDEGKLVLHRTFEDVEDAAELVLSEHIRHSILQVTQAQQVGAQGK